MPHWHPEVCSNFGQCHRRRQQDLRSPDGTDAALGSVKPHAAAAAAVGVLAAWLALDAFPAPAAAVAAVAAAVPSLSTAVQAAAAFTACSGSLPQTGS